ncbi:unnamed protein product [Caenorhabditis sp. 36 PRJEB53466]|nr:unnamed protein product [Caenorhabditis sp. 36 PRJEB53466]
MTPLGKVSKPTKLWLGVLHMISMADPMLHSFQEALPPLPVPNLDDAVKEHLISMKPIRSEEDSTFYRNASERELADVSNAT